MTIQESATVQPPAVFFGNSEMARLMREHDWLSTPLGDVATWPQSLRSAVSILLASGAEIVLYWGPDLVSLYNDGYSHTYGSKHPWALGRPARECWPEIWDVVEPLFQGVLDTGESFSAKDYPFLLERNGYREETYYDITYDPVRAEGGEVGGIFCIVSQTTGRILGERRLQLLSRLSAECVGARSKEEALSQAAAVLASSPLDLPFTLVYEFDHGRQELRLAGSSGFEGIAPAPETVALADGLFGIADPGGQLWESPVRVGGVQDFLSQLPLSPWGERPSEALVLAVRPTPSEPPAALLVAGVSPHREFDSDYAGFLDLVAQNIGTAMANAAAYENERLRAEALAELDRAKTLFLSDISHEFRTPLALLLGPLRDLLDQESLDVAVRENLQTSVRNGQRLLKLVNSLLEFSRIEAGRVNASYQPIDLAALTEDVASTFRATIESAGLGFRVDCAAPEGEVLADPEMWETIVLNLLSNAFKFTLHGEIWVRLRDDGGHVELAVSDTGSGVPPEEQARLFERFYRSRGIKSRSHEGSGIGLALVAELARLHGGEVAVRSAPGAGSTFTVRIPKGSAHLPPELVSHEARPLGSAFRAAFLEEAQAWIGSPAPPSSALVAEPAAGAVSTGTVLIVDDNSDMRRYLARLLGEHWEVVTARDAREALSHLETREVDVVVSDVMMPEIDGIELTRTIGQRWDIVPVLLLTARADEEAEIEALEAGAADYLVKPFSARELTARVRALQASARGRRDERQQLDHLYRLLMQAPLAIAVMRGPELTFEFTNELYSSMVGATEIVGQTFAEVFPEAHAQGYGDELRGVMTSGVPLARSEALALMKRGDAMEPEQTYWDYTFVPLSDAAGRIDRVMAVVEEVTGQVRAREALEVALRAKDDFLGQVSHELRNPLTQIAGNAEMLRRIWRDLPPGELEESIRQVHVQSVRLRRLVENMLTLSRFERGMLPGSEPNLVQRLLADTLEQFKQEFPDTVVDLTIHGDLAPVETSRASVEQVLWNLLTNAQKYGPRHGPVVVRAEQRDGWVELTVRDHGPGVPEGEMSRLFEPYFRSTSTPENAGGLGLGLSVCKRLIEAQGGRLWATRCEPSGMEFGVALPALSVDDA